MTGPILVFDTESPEERAAYVDALAARGLTVDTLQRRLHLVEDEASASLLGCALADEERGVLTRIRVAAEELAAMDSTPVRKRAESILEHCTRLSSMIRQGTAKRQAGAFSSQLADTVRGWIARYGLSEAEADVLVRAAEGQSRTQMANARGCSELTIKKHVSTMLRLLSDRSLQAAVARLLREMAGG
jgi:DNA-binding CsgD family transcriptional regulator